MECLSGWQMLVAHLDNVPVLGLVEGVTCAVGIPVNVIKCISVPQVLHQIALDFKTPWFEADHLGDFACHHFLIHD
jgi:hypothetical protein